MVVGCVVVGYVGGVVLVDLGYVGGVVWVDGVYGMLEGLDGLVVVG